MAPTKIKVSELYRNERRYDPRKRERLKLFFDAFDEFVDMLTWETHWSDEELEQTKYFDYLFDTAFDLKKRRPSRKYILSIIKDGIALFKSIDEDGIKDPVTMRRVNGRNVLCRGYRRIVIANALGIEEVAWIPE